MCLVGQLVTKGEVVVVNHNLKNKTTENKYSQQFSPNLTRRQIGFGLTSPPNHWEIEI